MPTILVLDDDPADNALIRRIVTDSAYPLLTSKNVNEFQLLMVRQPVDLAIISLTTISETDIENLQRILRHTPETKVIALAPSQHGNGLTTLLRAESLQAHHLLAKPIDPQQLLTILNLAFPLSSQQG